jgi:hypothetical protein
MSATTTELETAEILTAVPRYFSEVPPDTDISETQAGAEALGLPLLPQGINEARLFSALDSEGGSLRKTCVVQMPRRSTKSTSIWATIIGRALKRPKYKCVTTAQSGTVASSILLEHGEMLETNGLAGYKRKDPDEVEGNGTMRVLRNGGREKIEFSNGSVIWCVPPTAAAVRSKAADDIVIDEAGEFDGDKGDEFMTGVLPLMDTRGERAQLFVAGTPGRIRSGLFWELLEAARKGDDEDLGILDYSASDEEYAELNPLEWVKLTEDEKEIERRLWRKVHPGPSAIKPDGSPLTSMRTLERRRRQMAFPQFAREYLCLWPMDSSVSAIDMDAWKKAEQPAAPFFPEKFAWAFDCAPDGSSAALVAAWREDNGEAWVEVMRHEPGTDWLVEAVREISKTTRTPVAYDRIGANMDAALRLETARPALPSTGLHYVKGVVPAEAGFVRELKAGRLRHSGQASLTDALGGATWRILEGARLWGRKISSSDLSPAVAAALALHHYDTVVSVQGDTSEFNSIF